MTPSVTIQINAFGEVCHCDIVYVLEITFETVDGIQGCAHLSSTFLCCG